MTIAVSGLGRMGMQIARKLGENGHQVIANNRSPGPINEAVGFGALGAYSKEDTVKAFKGSCPVIWLMLPDSIIDSELKQWLKLLPKYSILVDGGNSDFRQTKKHAEWVKGQGSILIDVGTSGGVWGYKNGFSLMAGGDKAAFKTIEPALKTLSAPDGGYAYFGPSGSGHFVKMVHNAIEYGMMESLAEGYRLLKEGPYKNLELAAAGDVWQHGSVIVSWLNELTKDALKENPGLKEIEGVVAESGEARWALETAEKYAVPMPAIQSALDVRRASQKGETSFATKLLAAMRNRFGGHDINPTA